MNRRDFLKTTGQLSAGAMLSTFLMSATEASNTAKRHAEHRIGKDGAASFLILKSSDDVVFEVRGDLITETDEDSHHLKTIGKLYEDTGAIPEIESIINNFDSVLKYHLNESGAGFCIHFDKHLIDKSKISIFEKDSLTGEMNEQLHITTGLPHVKSIEFLKQRWAEKSLPPNTDPIFERDALHEFTVHGNNGEKGSYSINNAEDSAYIRLDDKHTDLDIYEDFDNAMAVQFLLHYRERGLTQSVAHELFDNHKISYVSYKGKDGPYSYYYKKTQNDDGRIELHINKHNVFDAIGIGHDANLGLNLILNFKRDGSLPDHNDAVFDQIQSLHRYTEDKSRGYYLYHPEGELSEAVFYLNDNAVIDTKGEFTFKEIGADADLFIETGALPNLNTVEYAAPALDKN